MSANRISVFVLASLALSLQACTSTPVAGPTVSGPASVAATPVVDATGAGASGADSSTGLTEAAPEVELNLDQPGNCNCGLPESSTQTYLDQGFAALLDGEYSEATTYFKHYQRVESSVRADWEAAIAIAYIQMLPRAPSYDPLAAQRAFQTLRKEKPKELNVHPYTRLMRQSLLNFIVLQREIAAAKANNATLKEDLEKREEALKRLRALTLGEKGSAP